MELRERLQYIFKETNPWWKEADFAVKSYRERKVYAKIEKFLKLPQIIALVGLRRTGKTTLMLKIAESYLRRIPASNVLYFSFDDFSGLDLEDLMAAYKEIFPQIDLRSGEYLFCFDEAQKLDGWQDKLKRLYDTYKNIKIIISGSESLFIRKGIKETLGGRIFEFRVSQLNFSEYLQFIGKQKFIENPLLYKEDLLRQYRFFLKTNGFPELAAVRDNSVIHKYLKESVMDKILFKDIPQLFKVRDPGVLGEILDIIIYSPGQIIDMTKLAKELSLSRQVVSSYLDYLEKAFLIKKLYNFSKNLRKQKRALKKFYPAIVFPEIVEEKFPLCFENHLIWELGAHFFWRDAYKNEVDAVLADKNKKITAVEIKTGEIDLKSVNSFMEKYKLSKGLVITIDKEGMRGNVRLAPFYKQILGS
ncbi:MAG: ATP-binding protein [Candidatus Omnitrophota bacterium]|nr:ATP-binding protein [Candidatus Omnitrophota bacterium]